MDMKERLTKIDKIAKSLIERIGEDRHTEDEANDLLHRIQVALYALRLYSREHRTEQNQIELSAEHLMYYAHAYLSERLAEKEELLKKEEDAGNDASLLRGAIAMDEAEIAWLENKLDSLDD